MDGWFSSLWDRLSRDDFSYWRKIWDFVSIIHVANFIVHKSRVVYVLIFFFVFSKSSNEVWFQLWSHHQNFSKKTILKLKTHGHRLSFARWPLSDGCPPEATSTQSHKQTHTHTSSSSSPPPAWTPCALVVSFLGYTGPLSARFREKPRTVWGHWIAVTSERLLASIAYRTHVHNRTIFLFYFIYFFIFSFITASAPV